MNNIFEQYSELELQRLIRKILADSSQVWRTVSEENMQVLSVGEWNHGAGPDFQNVALLVGGSLLIGNAEFHRTAAEWTQHGHHLNSNYGGLLLHIVLHNNSPQEFARYTLALGEADIRRAIKREQAGKHALQHAPRADKCSNDEILSALELLQEYAHRRLQHKTAHAISLLQHHSLHETLLHIFTQFIERQSKHQRRPTGIVRAQEALQKHIGNSIHAKTLHTLSAHEHSPHSIASSFTELLENPIASEGKGTRLEILVNVVLPIALALASREEYNVLLAWFWSLPALNSYAPLKRKFTHIPQRFVWQQQGMLEYIAETQRAETAIAETNSYST